MRSFVPVIILVAASSLAASCGSTSRVKEGEPEAKKDAAKSRDPHQQLLAGAEKKAGMEKNEKSTAGTTKAEQNVDMSFLLSMSYDEAAAMSAEKIELPKGFKLAGDKIQILRTNKEGKPTKVRATGHVYVQVEDELPYTALCQEALVSNDEVILRGKPVTQRGVSMIEGLSDVTVFYMFGSQLRAIGAHKISKIAPTARQELAQASGSGPRFAFRGHGDLPLPFSDIGPWKSGSNPLLPPLDEGAVPISIRNQLRAAEAEAALQDSREGVPPAFPEAQGQGAEKKPSGS